MKVIKMKLRLPQRSPTQNALARLSAVSTFAPVLVAVVITAALGHAEPLPLDRAIRLALTHGTSTAIASADVRKAFASYRELRNNYLPQLVVGSGLGWSYGFPLTIEGSAPALLNAVAQSSV